MSSHAISYFEHSVPWLKLENLVVKNYNEKIYLNPQLIRKKSHTYYIVGGLFMLTTRFCNLMGVEDPIKDASCNHYNTIQKNCHL
jgi:hypothetical protein